MSVTLEVLNSIYEQVKNKEEWHQGGLFSRDGSRMCLMARIYCINDLPRKEAVMSRLYEALLELKEPLALSNYNDTHSHQDVLQLIVRAIALEKKSLIESQRTSSVARPT